MSYGQQLSSSQYVFMIQAFLDECQTLDELVPCNVLLSTEVKLALSLQHSIIMIVLSKEVEIDKQRNAM